MYNCFSFTTELNINSIYIFYYSTTYNAYRDYNTNNVNITYEANYNKNETILRLDTTEIRFI